MSRHVDGTPLCTDPTSLVRSMEKILQCRSQNGEGICDRNKKTRTANGTKHDLQFLSMLPNLGSTSSIQFPIQVKTANNFALLKTCIVARQSLPKNLDFCICRCSPILLPIHLGRVFFLISSADIYSHVHAHTEYLSTTTSTVSRKQLSNPGGGGPV